MCKCTRTFLSIMQPHFFPSVFSPFWRENLLVSLRRKHLNLTIYFPSSLVSIQPITFQKSFHSYFLPKVFYPPYFTSKQTQVFLSKNIVSITLFPREIRVTTMNIYFIPMILVSHWPSQNKTKHEPTHQFTSVDMRIQKLWGQGKEVAIPFV